MLKFKTENDDKTLTVIIRGQLDASRCECLENFWDCCVFPDDSPELVIELAELEDYDSESIAQLLTIIRQECQNRQQVTLDSAPQVLAHTLYKTAVLENSKLSLTNTLEEEPYAG